MSPPIPFSILARLRAHFDAPALRPVLWFGVILFSLVIALAAGPVEAMGALAFRF